MSGLEAEFGGRIAAENVDATSPESVAVIRKLGFRNHGIVIRDTAGTVVWKQPDHEVKIEQVREALERLSRG